MTASGSHSPAWPHGQAPARTGNGMAVAALVLGILALLTFWTVIGGIVLGLIGLVLGILGVRRARGGRAPRRGMAITGTILSVVGALGGAAVLVAGLSFLNSDSYKSYRDCIEHADSQVEQQRCAQDFKGRTGS